MAAEGLRSKLVAPASQPGRSLLLLLFPTLPLGRKWENLTLLGSQNYKSYLVCVVLLFSVSYLAKFFPHVRETKSSLLILKGDICSGND